MVLSEASVQPLKTKKNVVEKLNMSRRCEENPVKRARRDDGLCWSCVACGFGDASNPAQNGAIYKHCCKACFADRYCRQCGTFQDAMVLPVCSQCECRIARWCSDCNAGASLRPPLCVACVRAQERAEAEKWRPSKSARNTEGALDAMEIPRRQWEVLRFALDEWSRSRCLQRSPVVDMLCQIRVPEE